MLGLLNIKTVKIRTGAVLLAASFFIAAICLLPCMADEPASPRTFTLQDLLRIAAENHPLLKESSAGINLQKALELQTQSAYWPQINFQNNFQEGNSRGGLFGTSPTFTNYTSFFSVSQLLTDFGRTSARVEASSKAVAQAEESYQNTFQSVLFNVSQAYYQVLAGQAVLKVQQDSVANLEEHLKQTETFFNVGTHPKIDVAQAEVNLSNGKLSLVQAQNSLDIARTNLRSAVGQPDLPLFQLRGELSFEDFPVTLEQALKTAYGNRPDLKGLEAQEESQQASLDAAIKNYFPTLSGSASYGWLGSSFPPQNNSWNLGVSLSFNVFNGLLTQGEINQAKAQLDQIKAQISDLKLTVRQGVEQAFLNLRSAKESLKVAEDSFRFAKENFELAQGRYRVGVGNYLEYTDAHVSLVQAETNEVQALANCNIAVASLKQAMGTLEEK